MQKNVIEYLWKTVERVPDKIAVDDNKEDLTGTGQVFFIVIL